MLEIPGVCVPEKVVGGDGHGPFISIFRFFNAVSGIKESGRGRLSILRPDQPFGASVAEVVAVEIPTSVQVSKGEVGARYGLEMFVGVGLREVGKLLGALDVRHV